MATHQNHRNQPGVYSRAIEDTILPTVRLQGDRCYDYFTPQSASHSGCSADCLWPAFSRTRSKPPDKSSHSAPAGWNICFDGSGSRPALADGILYIGSADGGVYALDANTGAQKWRFQTGEDLPVLIGPLIVAGPPGNSATDALTSGAGVPDDKSPLEYVRRVNMQPLVENGTVFVGSGDQSLYALDAATGKKKWSYLAGPGMASNNNTSYPVAVPPLCPWAVSERHTEGCSSLLRLGREAKISG